jgi:hypothetical protein
MDREIEVFVLDAIYDLSLRPISEPLNNPFKLFEFRKFNACHKSASAVVIVEMQYNLVFARTGYGGNSFSMLDTFY